MRSILRDKVTIRTPIAVRDRVFECVYTPSTDRIAVAWKS